MIDSLAPLSVSESVAQSAGFRRFKVPFFRIVVVVASAPNCRQIAGVAFFHIPTHTNHLWLPAVTAVAVCGCADQLVFFFYFFVAPAERIEATKARICRLPPANRLATSPWAKASGAHD